MDLKNRTALITGAAGAIGKGIAAAFCREGAKAFLTDINQEALDRAVQEIRAEGGTCWAQAADVTQADPVRSVVRAAHGAMGRMDILVNVAGIVAQAKVEEIAEAEWDRVFEVNCKGTFLFIREVVPLMKDQQ